MKPWNVVKGCLATTLLLFVALIVIVAVVLKSISNDWDKRRKQADIDSIEQSAMCDTISSITESPAIYFCDFELEEINKLTFWILRNGKLIDERKVGNFLLDSKRFKIPYHSFLKTDTILVKTETPLYYYISGYHHYAYLHYGMFGYLGSSHCSLSDDCMVNGEESHGVLCKSNGLEEVPFFKTGK